MKLNTDLIFFVSNVIKQLLKKYKDIFVWMYKDSKGIPPPLT